MNIPTGYQLHSTSWENDGDNYKTVILSGLTVEDVKFYLDIANQFSRAGKHGNENIETDDLIQIVVAAFENHPGISSEVRALWLPEGETESPDEYFDHLMETLRETLLESPDQYYDCNFCRRFDGFKVFYFPVEVEERTAAFKVN